MQGELVLAESVGRRTTAACTPACWGCLPGRDCTLLLREGELFVVVVAELASVLTGLGATA